MIIELAFKTGLRRAELANLKGRDIQDDFLIAREGKGKKDRIIPLPNDLASKLENWVKAKSPDEKVFGLGAPAIGMKITAFAKKAGLANMHTHALRHKFATDLLESGADIKAVQALLGHQNLNTTEKYLSMTDERLHDAIKKREQFRTANQAKNGVQAGDRAIQAPIERGNIPAKDSPTTIPLPEATITNNSQGFLPETPHKKQMRETAHTLKDRINLLLFIGERLKDERVIGIEPLPKQTRVDWFAGDVLLEGLSEHLETGGFPKVLQDIDDFDQVNYENLVSCHQFVGFVRKEIEESFQTSIPLTESGKSGFTMAFVQTVCADAVERARGSNHYQHFPYRYENSTLKFGAYIIYVGIHGQGLKPLGTLHRQMRRNCLRRKQAKKIADQIEQLSKIQAGIRHQLETFASQEYIPGKCHLCSRLKKQPDE